MPKFIVGVIATTETEVEADTQEEAEALAIASTCLLNSASAEWSIDYCDELDEDDEDDEDDLDLSKIENFKFANEA